MNEWIDQAKKDPKKCNLGVGSNFGRSYIREFFLFLKTYVYFCLGRYVHCTNTKQRRKRQNYTSSFVFQMRNLAENKGGNFKIYIFYCEFSCFGFSHSQDDRAGISKNLQLFLSLPWLFLDCILSCIPVFLFVFLEYCGMQSCYALF